MKYKNLDTCDIYNDIRREIENDGKGKIPENFSLLFIDAAQNIIYASRSLELSLGYASGRMSGQPVGKYFYGDHPEGGENGFENMLENGCSAAWGVVRAEQKHKNGTFVRFDTAVTAVRDTEGILKYIKCILRPFSDVRERDRIKASGKGPVPEETCPLPEGRRLLEDESELRKIFPALPMGILLYDENGNYLECNPKTKEILRIKDESFLKKENLLSKNPNLSDFLKHYPFTTGIGYDPVGMKVYRDYLCAPAASRILHLSVTIIPLYAQSRPSPESGGFPERYLMVLTDTTALRKSETELKKKNKELARLAEKAQESDKLKSVFLAGASHGIRTPLNAIVGFSELIAMSPDPAERKTFCDIVKTNNDLLLKFINEVLDLSRIESGKTLLRYEVTDMNKVCRELAEGRLPGYAGKAGIVFKYPDKAILTKKNGLTYIRRDLLFTDPYRLHQIYVHLIDNAIKNTPEGTITISYELAEVDAAGKIIRLLDSEQARRTVSMQKTADPDGETGNKIMLACSVTDTGQGIEQGKPREVPECFASLDENKTGFGPGLSISRSLAECMEGFLAVRSRKGEGTEFIVFLPYRPAPAPEEGDIWEKTEDVSSEETTTRTNNINKNNNEETEGDKLMETNTKCLDILVAEDIDFNYLLVKAIIGKKHNLFRAKNGKEAIDLFGTRKFDLILMDVKMPEMDGITATKLIREKDKNIPIIAVTAYAFDSDKQTALEAGCNDYIVKPIEPKNLTAIVERIAGNL